ncbi:hypothetical protein ACRTTN_002989 [Escherichia coli]
MPLHAALLEVIATELTKAAEGNSTLISKTKRLLSRVDGFRAMGLLAEGTALMAGLPTGGLLSRGIGALRNITDGIQSQEEYEALGNIAKEGKETACGLIKPQIVTNGAIVIHTQRLKSDPGGNLLS